MPKGAGRPDTPFASRLERLFQTAHPVNRGPYTPAQVATAINDEAGEEVISGAYIWQLRTGRRDNPTYKHLVVLSRFFGVSPAYFFDDADTQRGDLPAEVLLALQDDRLREIVLAGAGLSERSLRIIKDMVDNTRTLETRPPARKPQSAGRTAPARGKVQDS
jgi:transcriptional regulator with XRE-family HTH domain